MPFRCGRLPTTTWGSWHSFHGDKRAVLKTKQSANASPGTHRAWEQESAGIGGMLKGNDHLVNLATLLNAATPSTVSMLRRHSTTSMLQRFNFHRRSYALLTPLSHYAISEQRCGDFVLANSVAAISFSRTALRRFRSREQRCANSVAAISFSRTALRRFRSREQRCGDFVLANSVAAISFSRTALRRFRSRTAL